MNAMLIIERNLIEMPRKPTSEVIEHRITLGTYERQLVSDVAGSYQFNKIANPIIRLISDNTAMALIIASLGLFLDRYLDINWREITKGMDNKQLNDWLETQNLVGAGIGGLIGLFLGGPFGAVAGATAGTVVVEGVEYALDEAGQLIIDNTTPSQSIAFVLSLYRIGQIFTPNNNQSSNPNFVPTPNYDDVI
tara:strand:- start:170 stop:748 length:579 start_codon:yes stop_codon:yes gene_type:complete